jgi:hypothetical protein
MSKAAQETLNKLKRITAESKGPDDAEHNTGGALSQSFFVNKYIL